LARQRLKSLSPSDLDKGTAIDLQSHPCNESRFVRREEGAAFAASQPVPPRPRNGSLELRSATISSRDGPVLFILVSTAIGISIGLLGELGRHRAECTSRHQHLAARKQLAQLPTGLAKAGDE
jgi:hypothetical protein